MEITIKQIRPYSKKIEEEKIKVEPLSTHSSSSIYITRFLLSGCLMTSLFYEESFEFKRKTGKKCDNVNVNVMFKRAYGLHNVIFVQQDVCLTDTLVI